MTNKAGPQRRTESVPDPRQAHTETRGLQHPADPSHLSGAECLIYTNQTILATKQLAALASVEQSLGFSNTRGRSHSLGGGSRQGQSHASSTNTETSGQFEGPEHDDTVAEEEASTLMEENKSFVKQA
jgi:hypothetical protein